MTRPTHLDAVRRVLGRIAGDPITWVPLVPSAAAFAFFNAPWWAYIPMALVPAGGVAWWWYRCWAQAYADARHQNLTAALLRENAVLVPRLQGEAAGLSVELARRVRRVATHKVTIDQRVLADLTPRGEEISAMIGGLCETLAQDLASVEDVEQHAEKLRTIEAALDAIEDAAAEIDLLLEPLPDRLDLPPEPTRLGKEAQAVAEELRQARNIRQRLEADLLSPEIPGNETSGGDHETPPMAQ